jgi:hypothetical protein
MAMNFLLQNAKYLDHNFGLAPRKNLLGKQTKIIVAEDNIPSNFTHLGQYAFTSRNQIFEKKMNWKDKDKQPHQDNKVEELKDPAVYFTITIVNDLQPGYMINGIRMEGEMHGGGKLQVRDLQSHKSKSMFALYHVYMDTPFHIIKKTLNDILCEAAKMLLLQRMLPNDKPVQPILL